MVPTVVATVAVDTASAGLGGPLRDVRGAVPVDLGAPVHDLLGAVGLGHGEEDEDAAPVLLVHGNGRAATVAAAQARALAPPGRLLLVPVDLPPLARACAGLLLTLLADRVEATLLAGSAKTLVRELVVVARLGSVAGLRRPAPSLLQHMRSVLPGGGYLVTLQPEAAITAWSDAAVQALPPASPDCVLVLGRPDDDRHGERLRSQLAAEHVVTVRVDDAREAWWGTRNVTEAVLVPVGRTRLEQFAEQATRDAYSCQWCHAPLTVATCPACSMTHTR